MYREYRRSNVLNLTIDYKKTPLNSNKAMF